jgi:hypothetical protein
MKALQILVAAILAAGLGTATIPAFTAPATASTVRAPNVVFIMTDDLSRGDLGS